MGNIDNSLVEAARVDGATEMQVFWKIKCKYFNENGKKW